MTSVLQRPASRSTARRQEWVQFNVHDRLRMRVARNAPTASLLTEMFAPFLGEGVEECDITVTAKDAALAGASYAEHDYRYTEHGIHMEASRVQIRMEGSGYRVSGTRELLTTVLPLIDLLMACRGAAMIHAATFSHRGRGIALPAWGGTGKTSTMAKLMRLDGVDFMGDDWAFVTREGALLGYAKPMFIKPHHRAIYPHVFAEHQKPLIPSSISAPVARFTTLVHPLVTQYPTLARLSRRWSPEYLTVRPQEAFPGAVIAHRAPLGLAMFVDRFDGEECVLEERDRDWMVSRLVGNFHSEITRHSQEVLTAMAATGLISLEGFFGEKADVLRTALAGVPVYLLRVPKPWSADKASDRIVEHVLAVLEG
jgi:hypothetical protein